MPTTPPTLTPVPFLEAIAWARARKVILPEVYYGELQGLARSMAFPLPAWPSSTSCKASSMA